ncbi:MAG: serine/threonine-protein kinase, partial [Phormidesmis sp.]
MQPPISIGTLLQNHYRVVQLLGQGGFGRTYLAEDQGRFNERCAIKEFVPIQGEDHFSDKATQLFKREASVLYQISHPQIPQFRATFEEDERLFLVQDYVDGPTFHEVLNQRRQQGQVFSEAEVKLFLKQILPVLAHIHAKGIIHRDISPDNIILRQQDRLPVLIDFGVVKEVVTRMQLEGMATPATTVGKAGYAPSEQMQTGRAYPSSDLYALAVTCIVLMSGKEPQTMFDDVNFAWRWQDSVTVGSGFADILNKALAYKPGDRFQSVSEMAKALAAGGVVPETEIGDRTRHTPTPPVPQRPARPAAPVPPPSQMKTVAVGRAYPDANRTAGQDGTRINNPTTVGQNVGQNAGRNASRHSGQNAGRNVGQNRRTRRAVPAEPPESSSLLENPLAVGGLAVGLAIVAGFGGWAVVKGLDSSPTPTPTIT